MNVTVTVAGIQRLDGDTARTALTAVGTLKQQGQAVRLIYEEPATADTAAAITTITVTPRRVTVDRHGDTRSSLVLEQDRTHRCPYHTPYGTLSLDVTARTIVNELNTPAGRLLLAYTLDMGGAATENEIEITVKEVSY